MKRRICCLLLVLSVLCLPAQEAFAAPQPPQPPAHEHPKPHEEKKPHEKLKPKKHPKPHEKPVAPHEKEEKGPLGEKPVPPHEKEKTQLPTVTQPEKEETVTAPEEDTSVMEPSEGTIVTIPSEDTSSGTISVASEQIAEYALRFVGNPYKYGGTSLTNGADCSGFVQSVYAHFGYSISRTSKEQARNAGYMDVALKESDLQPGDLIFYANSQGVVYHVALYIGNGKVVHAANSKSGIIVSEYTYMKPYKARRVVEC